MHTLQDYIGYRFIQVARAHRNRAEIALNQLGLYTGQEMVLFHLWEEEGLTPSGLADRLCVGAPTITKSLKRLEQAGWVERRQDDEDARVFRVYLTAAGRALEAPVREIWADLERATTQGFSEAEKRLLRRFLDQMSDNLAR